MCVARFALLELFTLLALFTLFALLAQFTLFTLLAPFVKHYYASMSVYLTFTPMFDDSRMFQDIRSRTNISGHSEDRVLAQDFDAVLAVIVI